MNYAVLVNELETDPRGRGYASMTDAERLADLKTAYRPRTRSAMSGDEVFACTDTAEFASLSDSQKQLWMAFCARSPINPSGVANVDFVKSIFGETSQTVTHLADSRQELITREAELGLIGLTEGDLQRARTRATAHAERKAKEPQMQAARAKMMERLKAEREAKS